MNTDIQILTFARSEELLLPDGLWGMTWCKIINYNVKIHREQIQRARIFISRQVCVCRFDPNKIDEASTGQHVIVRKTSEAATEIMQWRRVNTPSVDSVNSIESPSWSSGMSLSNANRFGGFQVKTMMRRSFLLQHRKPKGRFFNSACQNMIIDCGAGARLSFLLQGAVYLPGRCCCLCEPATFK